MIESMVEDGRGDLYVANGIDSVLRWDGYLSQFEEAGLDAPTSTPAVSGSGVGAIVGEYYAYLRFVDRNGNVSNLSPISAVYNATNLSGTVTAATNASPIVITSAAHGLLTGASVKIEGVGGNTSANNTWIITVIDANSFSLDDSHGTASYNGGGTWTSGVGTISYSSLQAGTDPKVYKRQILRNTDGQTTTFYVDVETTDLSSASLSSTRTDEELSAQTAVPILDADLNPSANRHDKPLDYYRFLCPHKDRLFSAGILEYNRGHLKVTNGSTTVTGVGTDWQETMAGRLLYVSGGDQTYEIDSVSESAQTLTLTETYTGATDQFAFYSIKPPPAYRRLVAFSEPGLSQSWPAINAIDVQETGDEITGLMTKGSFLYILESRHIHKLTYAISPIKDGAIFMAAERGVINNRSWVVVDDQAYMLDELGIHRFMGGNDVEHLSTGIQGLFRADEDSPWKVQWAQKEFFFATLDRQRETIRWFVTLDGSRYPRHAIALQYRQTRFWIEEYPFPVGGACVGQMTHIPQAFYGAQHAKVLAAWWGTTDLVTPEAGDVRSTATSSATFSLTDTESSWPTTGIVNTSIGIVAGTGKGQRRRIVAVSGTTLTVDSPWAILPDATSLYQIGGIHYKYRANWLRLSRAETTAQRRFEMSFEPTVEDAVADLRFFADTQDHAEVQQTTISFDHGGGIATTKGKADMQVDLKRESGTVQKQLPGHKDHFITGKRWTQFEVEGETNADPVRIYHFLYEGVVPDGGLAQEN